MARNGAHKLIYRVQIYGVLCTFSYKTTFVYVQMTEQIRTLHGVRLEQIAHARQNRRESALVSSVHAAQKEILKVRRKGFPAPLSLR